MKILSRLKIMSADIFEQPAVVETIGTYVDYGDFLLKFDGVKYQVTLDGEVAGEGKNPEKAMQDYLDGFKSFYIEEFEPTYNDIIPGKGKYGSLFKKLLDELLKKKRK